MAYKQQQNFINLLRLFAAISLFLCASSHANETDDLTLEEAKVHYVIEITKQIRWPNEQKLKRFTVGIVTNQNELIKAFQQREGFKVRNRPLHFERIKSDRFDPNKFNIVFLANDKKALNSKIFKKARTALIIADGRIPKDQLMISLITTLTNIKIRLNRDNLSNNGFRVSTNLLKLAGTKEDLSDQLRDNEQRLRAMLSEVKSKETQLQELNSTLEKNRSYLEEAENKISANEKELKLYTKRLESLSGEISLSQEEINLNKEALEQQKLDLAEKQALLESKEHQISKNEKVLQQQFDQIEQQSNMIENRDKTISTQREWMIAILVVTLIFFVMIYFLSRAIRLKRKAYLKLENLNSQLYEMATQDGMTKLFNRRHFLETAQKGLERDNRGHHKSAILMMDIDRFKKVNDTYGHSMGDKAIIAVADIFKKHLRHYDIVGRLGGEEFAMMLSDCDIQVATQIANRLCEEVENRTINHNDQTINITISIGLTLITEEDQNIEQPLIRADQALYEAKDAGRNQVVIYEKFQDA